jgi:hypothetical protein
MGDKLGRSNVGDWKRLLDAACETLTLAGQLSHQVMITLAKEQASIGI